MKKIVMLMVIGIVTCFSAICFAANDGELLNAEQKSARLFFDALTGKASYAKVSSLMTPVMTKKLTAEEFAKTRKFMEKFGALSDYRFMSLAKMGNERDGVMYVAKGSNAQDVKFFYVFKTSGEKPLMNEVRIGGFPNTPAQAEEKDENKKIEQNIDQNVEQNKEQNK